MRRTYVYAGHPYAVVYRGYYYHGAPYYRYAPPYYNGPGYYRWAYDPWPRRFPGRGAGPPLRVRLLWILLYPIPRVSVPGSLATDYLLAENLRASYEAQAAASAPAEYVQRDMLPPRANPPEPAPAPDNASVTLTPEVKQAIAEQVGPRSPPNRQLPASARQPHRPTNSPRQ